MYKVRWSYYKLRQLSLLQSLMDSYYKLRQIFITAGDTNGQLLQIATTYYKLRRGLLRIATGVTKCDGVIAKIATVQTSLQGRSLSSLLSTLYILARVG